MARGTALMTAPFAHYPPRYRHLARQVASSALPGQMPEARRDARRAQSLPLVDRDFPRVENVEHGAAHDRRFGGRQRFDEMHFAFSPATVIIRTSQQPERAAMISVAKIFAISTVVVALAGANVTLTASRAEAESKSKSTSSNSGSGSTQGSTKGSTQGSTQSLSGTDLGSSR